MDERYTVLEPEKESLLGTGLRGVARAGARALESVAGLPADIVGGGLALSDVASHKLGSLIGSEKLQKANASKITDYLPTSSNIRKYGTENIERALGTDYLTPRTKGEERFDEYVGDVASLLVPFGGGSRISLKALKSAGGTAALGNLAKWGAEELGGGEGTQAGAKIGAMLLPSIFGAPSVKKYMDSLYEKTSSLLPKKEKVLAKELTERIKSVSNDLSKGTATPTKDILKKPVKDIKKALKRGKGELGIIDAVQFKKDLNEIIRDSSTTTSARGQLKEIVHDINKSINTIGKEHPEFLKSLRSADNIWAGLTEGSKVTKFLDKYVQKYAFHPLTLGLLGLHGGLGTALKVGGSLAGYEGFKVLQSFAKSREIRKYYGHTVSSALKNNAPQSLKSMQKLDEAIRKQEQGEYIVL